jgi:hypothetical protein
VRGSSQRRWAAGRFACQCRSSMKGPTSSAMAWRKSRSLPEVVESAAPMTTRSFRRWAALIALSTAVDCRKCRWRCVGCQYHFRAAGFFSFSQGRLGPSSNRGAIWTPSGLGMDNLPSSGPPVMWSSTSSKAGHTPRTPMRIPCFKHHLSELTLSDVRR